MTPAAINIALEFLRDWQKTTIVLAVVIVAAWPTVAVTLYLEHIGTFGNIYQMEHAALSVETQGIRNTQDVIIRGINQMKNSSEDTAYFLQQDCVRKAETTTERDECVKPKWKRKTIEERQE